MDTGGRLHAAGDHHHAGGGKTAAGDGGADIAVVIDLVGQGEKLWLLTRQLIINGDFSSMAQDKMRFPVG